MADHSVPRVFLPGAVITAATDALEPASADDTFYVVGPPERHGIAGFLVPIDQLEACGIPRKVAREVAMIVSLRTSEHMILLAHEGGLWELLIESGKHGLPDTYTFRAGTSGKSGTI